MADKRDYYDVLGVSKTADDAEIKKAFRTLAKKYHPDAHPGDAECEAKFKEAQEAYAVLSDAEKRRQYDQFGLAAFEGAGGAGGFDFSGMDMSDIFGDIFGDFFGGGGFGGFGGGSRRANNGPRQGANVRMSVRISFEEAVFGCEKEIEFNYKETCKTCGGNGAKPGTSPESCPKCGGKGKVVMNQQTLFGMMQNVTTCPDCNGSGKIVKERCTDCYGSGYIVKKIRKTVEIPAGIDNGQCVRVREFGEPGINNGPRGDLLVEVVVSRSSQFERQDALLRHRASGGRGPRARLLPAGVRRRRQALRAARAGRPPHALCGARRQRPAPHAPQHCRLGTSHDQGPQEREEAGLRPDRPVRQAQPEQGLCLPPRYTLAAGV